MGKIIDLTGQKFGRLTVIERAPNHISPCGHSEAMWVCKCECGNTTIVSASNLRKGQRSCGCLKGNRKRKEVKDLTGQVFGKLTVKKRAPDRISPSGRRYVMWECECECGNIIQVRSYDLNNNNPFRSCGCYRNKITSERQIKYNSYDISGAYGIGYTYNVDPTDIQGIRNYFYFDLEDYDIIKEYCWCFNIKGYLIAQEKGTGKQIKLHRLIVNASPNDIVDHIYHDKYDNRKQKIRVVTSSQNCMNRQLSVKNTTGYKGVCKKGDKYRSWVCLNYKKIHLGTFDTLEEAVEARQQAEEKYYGEYRYQEAE